MSRPRAIPLGGGGAWGTMLEAIPTGGSLVASGRDRPARVTVEGALWLVVLVSVVLDVYTTRLGLATGLSEGNPVMRWAIGTAGVGALVAAKVVAISIALAVRRVRPRYGPAVAAGLAVPWTATVIVNVAALA